MIKIVTFDILSEDEKINKFEEIKDVFFLSTSKSVFDSPEQKEEFFNKWCGDYLRIYPQWFFLVINQDKKLLGYLSGVLNTNEGLKFLRVPGIKYFLHLYDQFPAHLHINFHPDARGLGLGSILVRYYLDFLQERGVEGVHLITSPEAKNVNFYRRLGFVYVEEFSTEKMELLFMGRLAE